MTSLRAFVVGTAMFAAGIVGINGVAYAATGHDLIIGKSNKANSTTTLRRSGTGPVLALHGSTKSAPLSVNSSKVVSHLNADLVDGVHASALQTGDLHFAMPASGVHSIVNWNLPNVPKGIYEASYSIWAVMTGTNAALNCELDSLAPGQRLQDFGGQISQGYSAANDSGVFDLRKDSTLTMHCSASPSGTLSTGTPTALASVVDLVRIDTITPRAATLGQVYE